jgi:class 3 adenylate cyclase
LTFVFSDVAISTRRALERGDARWVELLDVHNSIVRRHVARHDGTEVKAQGGGFMLSFRSARGALACMIDVQRALQSLGRSRPTDALHVRAGIHSGEVPGGGDGEPFGRHVVLASRIAEAARAGEVLVSERVRQLVEPGGAFTFGAPRTVALKGLGPNHVVHPVLWERHEPRS